MTPLDAKLERFDLYASDAVDDLIRWLSEHRSDLVAVARGRHVIGHYLYGDRNFAEWDRDRLLAETAEELADAIVYTTRRLWLGRPHGVVADGDHESPAAAAEGSVA